MNDSNRLKHSVDIASLVQELVRRGSSLRKTSSGFTLEDTVTDSSTAVYAAIVIKKTKITLNDIHSVAVVSLSTGRLHTHLQSLLDCWVLPHV